MKKTPIVFLMILIFCVIFPASILNGKAGDNYGKLVGEIVDNETNQPVKEVFRIKIYSYPDGFSLKKMSSILSDDRGRFKSQLEPGKYCLEFSPKSRDSIYSRDLNALELPKEQLQNLYVKKGQIAKFVKRANRAGCVILKLYDTNSNPLDLKKTFGPTAGTLISVDTELFCWYESNESNASLAANEYKIFTLRPGKTKISITFTGTGYYFYESFNIDLKKNETHVIDVFVDLNNRTGIEGRYLNTNGKPHANARIEISGSVNISTYSDKNGLFKIFGLKEGVYKLFLYSSKNQIQFVDYINNINVKKNVMLKKDLILKDN